MIETLILLPPYIRKRLSSALECGMLRPPYETVSLRSILGPCEHLEKIKTALQEFNRKGIDGPVLAEWIRSLEKIVEQTPRMDLVWSGPEAPGLFARDTRRVFEELIGSAKINIWASTYAYFDGPKAFHLLAQRMDEIPELKVTLFLNIQRKRGDSSDSNHLIRQYARRFWNNDWPGKKRPLVFYDPRALDPEGPSGVLHAKALVVDDESVFITSANLTEAALDRNIEIGLLVRDRAIASTTSGYFRILIDTGLLQPLPGD